MFHVERIDIDFLRAAFWNDGRDRLGRVEFFLDHVGIEAEAVKINIKLTKIRQLELQHFFIPPTADFGEAVVGEDVGSALRVGEVAEADAGDGLEGEGLSGEDATVTGDDAVVLVDEDGVVEAELPD